MLAPLFALSSALDTMERMVFRKENGRPAPQPSSWDNEPVGDAITWDYGDDAVAFQPPRDSAPPKFGAPVQPDARTTSVQRALNQALDEWWRRGVLPSNDLLRDGLLVLQAGHELDESQRTLLLRTAIVRRRGTLTALRHQTDPERTAVLLEEAILRPSQPLSVDELRRLLQGDERSAEWTPALVEMLRRTAETDADKRALTTPALAVLTNAPPPAIAEAYPLSTPSPWIDGEVAPHRGSPWLQVALIVLLVAAVAAVIVWWWQMQQPDMADVPAGLYPVSTWPDGAAQMAEIPAFRIDRFEATVSQYRACYERGACPWPSTPASATRPDYLLDPAFAESPMINIDYDSADRFCRFMGKRLPTAAEWEVAAAYAPATGRMYRFPWGDEFAVQFANSAASGIGDTVQVGSFQPAGDSPLGAADMAGNVAEWTSSVVQAEMTMHLVKGGSFVSEADSLRTTVAEAIAPRSTANWLGVRCAIDAR
ncbi:MAG: SUMF1/EgtB/PvdO family nonheme iron enzyme [Caldilinea sp.]